ncbi:hypothetical protein AGMMS49942_24140 [Spirochaetia bacterium]|nr:hypothetical protein AGMMS49942_24140 [Spirochaetia bacterium]
MTIEQTLDRPAAAKVETFGDNEDICPICGKPHIPNAETLAAIAEGRAIMRGEIPGTWYKTREEFWKSLEED